MSDSAGNLSPAAADLQQIRLSGDLNPGLDLITKVIAAQQPALDAISEAIQILILLGQAPTAEKLYQAFNAASQNNRALPNPARARMALLLNREDLLEGIEPAGRPSWLDSLLATGEDPTGQMEVKDLQVRVENGPSVFSFSGTCPHCGHGLNREFRATILAWHEWLCPACFGKVHLGYKAAREALSRNFPGQACGHLEKLDQELIDRITPKMTGAEPAPFIVRALAQEYHFLLNQIILGLAADSQGGRAGS